MTFQQRDNTGALFKNERRTTDNHPHANGKCMIDGVMYWVSAWTKEGRNGKFQTLAFQRMEDQGQDDEQFEQSRPAPRQQQRRQAAPPRGGQRRQAPPPIYGPSDFDEDIPF